MPYAIRKTVVAEGEEPDTFWEAIGGKGDYQQDTASDPEPASHEPQLLLFSDAAPDGLEDLPGYTQDDLDDDEIFLLDAFYTVLVNLQEPVEPCSSHTRVKSVLSYLLKPVLLRVHELMPLHVWQLLHAICHCSTCMYTGSGPGHSWFAVVQQTQMHKDHAPASQFIVASIGQWLVKPMRCSTCHSPCLVASWRC